jgi:membrane-bound lytic murein transglycosylase F
MINKRVHPSKLLLILFVGYWLVFSVVFVVRQIRRTSGDLPTIQQKGILRVCGESDPFSYRSEADSTYGFHYELAKAFAQRHGLKLQYLTEASLSRRVNMLLNDQCDLLSGPLLVTSNLRQRIAFTKPIFESKLVLVQRSNTDENKLVRDVIHVKGKILYTSDNPAIVERLRHLSTEISDTIDVRILKVDSEHLVEMVASGKIDYAVMDRDVCASFQKKYPSIDTKTPLGFNQFQAWAVKPGRKHLLDSLNVFLTEHKRSAAFARLVQTYLVH